MTKHRSRYEWIAYLAMAALLLGCGESREELMASAKSYLAKNDTKAAVIQLKTALQKAESADARFLLGKALLASGDPAAASFELRKALDSKHSEAETIPLLARALSEQWQDKTLIEHYGSIQLAEPAATADLKTSRCVGAYEAGGPRSRDRSACVCACGGAGPCPGADPSSANRGGKKRLRQRIQPG